MVETAETIDNPWAGERGDAVIIDGVTIAPLKKELDNSYVKLLTNKILKSLTPEEWEHLKELESKFCDRSDFDKIKFLIEEVKSVNIFDEISKGLEERKIQDGLKKGLRGKDKDKALLFKDAGNKAFSRGNNERALHYYSLAAAWIPCPSNPEDKNEPNRDVSIIYGNRSASLFHLGEFSLCLNDIAFAFSLGYPVQLHHKLYERWARCLIQLGKSSEAIKIIQKALKSINTNLEKEPGDEKNLKTMKNLEDLLKNAKDNPKKHVEMIELAEDMQIPQVDGGCGSFLKAATKKLKVESHPDRGRYIMALEDIGPGEVILTEKPFVSFLTMERLHQQCAQCFTPLRAPIFCPFCNQVSFCNIKCRDLAMKTHHKYECQVLDVFFKAEISITCFMAFRAITRVRSEVGLKEILRWYSMVSQEKLGPVVSNDEDHYDGDVYRTDATCLFQLVTHSHRRVREDVFSRSIMALFMLEVLKQTQFFSDTEDDHQQQDSKCGNKNEKNGTNDEKNGNNDKENIFTEAQIKVESGWNETELQTAVIILRLLQLLQFNAHSIGGWGLKEGNSVFMGGGLYPSLSLFNHSCNPSIMRYFVNDTVVVRSVRTIRKGEEINENYGPVFTNMRLQDRKASLLNQYWFECSCVSCTENWPLFDNLSRIDLVYRCPSCYSKLANSSEQAMGIFLKCDNKVAQTTNKFRAGYERKDYGPFLKNLKILQATEDKYKLAMDMMEKGSTSAAKGIFIELIALFDTILCPPFRDYHLCQEGLRKCFLILGNKTPLQPFHL